MAGALPTPHTSKIGFIYWLRDCRVGETPAIFCAWQRGKRCGFIPLPLEQAVPGSKWSFPLQISLLQSFMSPFINSSSVRELIVCKAQYIFFFSREQLYWWPDMDQISTCIRITWRGPVKTQMPVPHPQTFWFRRSGVGLENLHFWLVSLEASTGPHFENHSCRHEELLPSGGQGGHYTE